jgi:ornithine cyclodeaminase/alanine dehydrogenase-like protein (mu-crystallin family)
VHVVPESFIREQVKEQEALAAVERGFRALAEARVVQPPPIGLDLHDAEGEVHVKGAYVVGSPIFAFKVACGFYRNHERGLPTGSGLVLVFDATTGVPLAVLHDNGYLTDLRTAGAGALAARLLAPSPIRKLAIIGTGIQGRYQLRAIRRVREWEEVAAWSPTASRLQSFTREMEAELGTPVRAMSSPREAVAGADLIVTATPSRTALLESEWVPPHATVIAVGSDGPEKQELDPALLVRADKVIADRLSQCAAIGEIHHAVKEGLMRPEDVYAELGDVVIGRKAGREGKELIVCDLTGVGVQDAAIAELSWEKVQRVPA